MTDLNALLSAALQALGDDELILGHRASEWCGHAPIVEEDIAFANLALDELGHAVLWYGLAAGLAGLDPHTTPDAWVYQRPTADFRCLHLVELPNGDWAQTMLRQYLCDSAELVRLSALAQGVYLPAAEIAAKIRKEELYHLRHTQAWLKRLALGTEESRSRLIQALEYLYPYTAQVFDPLPGEAELVAAGWLPASADLAAAWQAQTDAWLFAACELPRPSAAFLSLPRHQHTPHLPGLLAELQSVVRANPGALW